MHLTSATSVRELTSRLAEVLADVPADPFEPEWLAVPSDGMRRWLTLELAGHLGAVPGRGDGVAANIIRAYPGTLRTAVLAAGRGEDDADPWSLGRLVWAVLEVADRHPDPASAALGTVAPGASRYGRARQVADLFDRYHLQRPASPSCGGWSVATSMSPVHPSACPGCSKGSARGPSSSSSPVA